MEAAGDLIFRVLAFAFIAWLWTPQWSFTPEDAFTNVLFVVGGVLVLFGDNSEE